MEKFEVKSQFYLNNQPFKIHAGAVHYFRLAPSEWEPTLRALKLSGLNTVETYIPWNIHESVEGQFNFAGQADVREFVLLAQKLDLYVILRPSPYICAEWEFGGFPAWLLRYSDMLVRSNTPRFMSKVKAYYAELFKVLVPLQITHGGPVLMMQVENEYGSFGNDKAYLRAIKQIMIDDGVDVPLFTADGSWQQALAAGSLIDDDVLVTANFGSHSSENLVELRQFMKAHGKQWPLMCMEFWDGWFNRWQEKIIKRDVSSFKTDLQELVDAGASFNLYMFRGGTNFGFYNGSSSRQVIDYPQVTSYDYDAILHENGQPNVKFTELQAVLKVPSVVPNMPTTKTYPAVKAMVQVRLIDVLDELGQVADSVIPLPMEQGSGYGYQFYQTTVAGQNQPEKLKLVDAADRADIYVNQKLVATQYQSTLGDELEVLITLQTQLQILVENTGRVNYGQRLLSPTQSKGIRTGVVIDRHLHFGWRQWFIDFSRLSQVDWQTSTTVQYGPTLTRFNFDCSELHGTYLDCSHFGKGVAILNGHNLGRYWQAGPMQTLYIPKDFLKSCQNELVVFETTEKAITQLQFSDQAKEADECEN
ncbi:beta-galactosidase [Lactobacillus sp. CBA3605]|uniref:glycoside hydrolase family 35 protein n=1 Tax=Lactobacillus sp. CBA3605 TaxID=2099788 RepID=UPI000CFBB480|nr:beta-galactosidase family protein [Lactobacillus sp. CBA3605]AVK61484.1 beta-galactosidase [Lactobacillus sp. CBA3605]